MLSLLTAHLVLAATIAPAAELPTSASGTGASRAADAAGKLGYEMVRVAAGTYTVGSPANEAARVPNEALHAVTLTRAYALGTTEVTQGLWTRVMGSNPSEVASCGATCPVEHVSWCDAVVFANAASALEGLDAAYTVPAGIDTGLSSERCNALADGVRWNPQASGYRLPTEAEWEIAARAGAGRDYVGGSADDAGWYTSNAGLMNRPVASKKANAWGLYDMAGSVWEWTWDVFDGYRGDVVDPSGGSTGTVRSARGGSIFFSADYARSAYRAFVQPGRQDGDRGLRLARTVP